MSRMLSMLDPYDEIKKIYFTTTRETIERDMERALDLLTRMPTEEARDRVAGFMHGLSDLRQEWKPRPKGSGGAGKKKSPPGSASQGKRPAKPPAGPKKSG